MNHKVYKDKCEMCNDWKVCKGFSGLVLCDDCIKKEIAKPNEQPKKVGVKFEQTRFNI